MYLKRTIVPLLLTLLVACSSEENYPPVEGGLDAGRQFIDAIFKGNFKRAGMLLLPDETNTSLLKDRLETAFRRRSAADKNELSNSSIRIISSDEVVKDSITIINFINSYDNKPAVLKVVRSNGTWQVDLKYTFSGNL